MPTTKTKASSKHRKHPYTSQVIIHLDRHLEVLRISGDISHVLPDDLSQEIFIKESIDLANLTIPQEINESRWETYAPNDSNPKISIQWSALWDDTHEEYLVTGKISEPSFTTNSESNPPQTTPSFSKAIFETAASINDLAVFESFPEDDIHIWSDAVRTIFGFAPHEQVSFKKMTDLYTAETLAKHEDWLKNLSKNLGVAETGEAHFITQEGEEKWVEIRQIRNKLPDGKIHLVGSVRDITSAKLAEISLAEISENVSGFHFTVVNDKNSSKIISISGDAESYWGYPTDLLIKDHQQVIAGYNLDEWQLKKLRNEYRVALQKNEKFQIKLQYNHPSGEIYWHSISAELKPLPNNALIMKATLLDVTAEENARQLSESVNKLSKSGIWEMVLENNQPVAIRTDENFREIRKLEGGPVFPLSKLSENLAPSSQFKFRQILNVMSTQESEQGFDIEFLHEGTSNWVKVYAKSVFEGDKCQRIYGGIQDITDQKHAINKLEIKNLQMAILSQVSSDFLQFDNLEVAIESTLRMTGNLLEADATFFIEVNNIQNALKINVAERSKWISELNTAYLHSEEELFKNDLIFTCGNISNNHLKEGKIQVIQSDEIGDGPLKEELDHKNIKTLCLVPLNKASRFSGIIAYAHAEKKYNWTQEEKHLLRSMADILESACLRNEAQQEVNKGNRTRESILNSLHDGFGVLDNKLNVTYWNIQAKKITGIAPDQIIGKNIWEVMGEDIRKHFMRVALSQQNRPFLHFEQYYRGINKHLEVNSYPSEDGHTLFIRDITEKKEAELAMIKLNKDLELSNHELAQFAHIASHDLQEPLRMVTNFITQLENKYGNLLDQKGKTYVKFAQDGAKKMRKIMLELLQYSTIDNNQYQLTRVDLNEALEQVLRHHHKLIRSTEAKIIYPILPSIQSLETPLLQIFQNLIHNSLLYHRLGVSPVIDIQFEETKTNLVITVSDNGQGIPNDQLDRIFTIFHKLNPSSERSGVGLSVVKKSVEFLGGHVIVKSTLNQGSSFILTLPKAPNLTPRKLN